MVVSAQVVFRFSSYGSTWTETYYCPGVLNDDLEAYATYLKQQIVGAALAFRHPATNFASLSVRDTSGTRKAALRTVDRSNYLNLITGVGQLDQVNIPDVQGVSARVTIPCALGRNRHMWLRGLADPLTQRNNINGQANQSLMSAQLNQYFAKLKNANAGTRVTTPVPFPALPASILSWQPILSFEASPDNASWTRVLFNGVLVTPRPVPGVDYVYFKGLDLTHLGYLRGRFLVMNAGTISGIGFFDVPARYREALSSTPAPNTYWRVSLYQYSQWPSGLTYDFLLTTRDTAGPTGGRRGRRRRQVSRR